MATFEDFKKRYEEDKKKKEQVTPGFDEFKKRYERDKASSAASEIISRVNALSKQGNELIGEYGERYKDGTDKWRGDATDYYTSVSDRVSGYKTEAASILELLNQYGDYYDDDFKNSVKSAIGDGNSSYSQILSFVEGDKDFWSQWESEEEYNAAVENAKLYDLDIPEAQAKVERLQSMYDEWSKVGMKLPALKITISQLENQAKYGINRQQAQKELEAAKAELSGYENYLSQYTNMDNILDEITELNRQITLASRYQNAQRLSAVSDKTSDLYDPNFDTLSQYSPDVVNDADEYSRKVASGEIDPKYLFLNDREGYNQMVYALSEMRQSGNATFLSDNIMVDDTIIKHLSENEKALYNYYYNTGGAEAANSYLDAISESLNLKRGKEIVKKIGDRPLLQRGYGVVAGLDQFATGMKNLFSDEYVAPSATQYAGQMINEELGDNGLKYYNAKSRSWEQIKIFGKSTAQIAYEMNVTNANMLPSILAGLAVEALLPTVGEGAVVTAALAGKIGSVTGATLLGLSAAGNAKNEMLELGYSKKAANNYALLVGASEAGLSYLIGSIPGISSGGIAGTLTEKALKSVDNALAKVAILFADGADEAFEEGMQTVLETWFKEIATGVDFEDPNLDEVLYSSLLGFLSSAGFGGGKIAVDTVKDVTYNKNLGKDYVKDHGQEAVGDLIGKGLEMNQRTTAYKQAQKLQGKLDKGKKTSNYSVGRLYSSMSEAQISTALQTRLTSEGVSETDARKLGNTVTDIIRGREVSNSKITEVIKNSAARTILNESIGAKIGASASVSDVKAAIKSYQEVKKSTKDRTAQAIDKDSYAVKISGAGATFSIQKSADGGFDVVGEAEGESHVLASFKSQKQAQAAAYAMTLGMRLEGMKGLVTISESLPEGVSLGDAALVFNAIYNQGKSGKAMSAVRNMDLLSLEQRQYAYQNGIVDGLLERARSERLETEWDVDEIVDKTVAEEKADESDTVDESNASNQDEKETITPVKNLTKEQKDVVEAGKRLSIDVVIADIKKGKENIDGLWDGKTLYINPKPSSGNPMFTLLKHELTHFTQISEKYEAFSFAVTDSKVFSKWLKDKGFKNSQEYIAKIISDRKQIGENWDNNKGRERARREMVADFVGDVLFADDGALERFVNTLSPDHKRTFRDFVRDFITWIKKKLGTLSEIEMLEWQYAKLFKDAKKVEARSTAKDEGGEYAYTHKDENAIDNYTEKQYNDFGWASYSGSLTVPQINDLYSKIQEKKSLKMFPQSLNGEAIIAVNPHPESTLEVDNTLVFVKGTKKSFSITKVLVIDLYFETDIFELEEIIYEAEQRPWSRASGIVANMFESELVREFRRGDFASYQEYAAAAEQRSFGREGEGDNRNNQQQPRRENDNGKSKSDEVSDYSYTPSKEETIDELLKQYKEGAITEEEFKERFVGGKSKNDPVSVAQMEEKAADTTPDIQRRQGNVKGDGERDTIIAKGKASIFSEEFKKEVETDEFIQKYKTITNEETLKMAAEELDREGDEGVQNWLALNPVRASVVDIVKGFILLDRYRRLGNVEGQVRVAQKISDMGTAAGQSVQSFTILRRLDSAAMLAYSQKSMDSAFQTMAKGKTEAWLKKYADRFKLTDEDIEYIFNRTILATTLPDGRDKDILIAQIAQRLQDKLPPERGQSAKALQRISMLLNPKTIIRNVVGNISIAPVHWVSDWVGTVTDIAASKIFKTGVRTTSAISNAKENAKAFGRGAVEAYVDWRKKINTQVNLDRFDIDNAHGKSFDEHGKMRRLAQALNAMDRLTSFALAVGDRPFYEYWFMRSINSQVRANKVDTPTAEMIEIATQEALQRTWQDDNKFSQFVSGLKRGMNTINVLGYGAGDVIIKFTKTPANIAKAIYDLSPVGFVSAAKAAVNLNNAVKSGKDVAVAQKKFVKSFSNAFAGTLLYVMMIGLFNAGRLIGKSDEDKDVAAFEKWVQGIPAYSFKLGGKWFSYEWMQPIGSAAAIVSDCMQAKDAGVGPWDSIVMALKSGGNVFMEQSFLQSFQRLFSADSFFDGLWDMVASDPSAWVPQIFSQFANTFDDTRRVTYDKANPTESILNAIKYKIPGLRNTLTEDVDVFGRDVPNSQANVGNAFFNPANTYVDTSDKVTDHVYSLYKELGSKAMIPAKAPYSITVDGKSIPLSAEERANYQRIMGGVSYKIIAGLLESELYNSYSLAEKEIIIKDVYAYAKKIADSSYSTEITFEMINATHPYILRDDFNAMTDEQKKETYRAGVLKDYSDILKSDEDGVIAYFETKAAKHAVLGATKAYDADKVSELLEIAKANIARYSSDDEVAAENVKAFNQDVKSTLTKWWKEQYRLASLEEKSSEMERIEDMLVAIGLYGKRSEVRKKLKEWLEDQDEW